MKSELIVDVRPSEISIALLEDSRLVSLQKEARNISYAVGDIYLAKVKKLMPALNAAFVNVGYEKDAFLHYLDLGPHFTSYKEYLVDSFNNKKEVPILSRSKLLPEIDKHGTITDLLQCGQELLVQIVKEPISSKGPRLTTELSFTGRFMVLIPFSDKISISQKIKAPEERSRLRQLIASIKPKNFGVIIRTSAEGKRVAELNSELELLLESWKSCISKAQKSTAPALVFEEESRILSILRDIFSSDFESIHVNDPDVYRQIVSFVSQIAPESKDIVQLYDSEIPIFDHFSITRQIKSSFGKTVSFKSGSYIIIEHTEALHVIDVNSGNRAKGAPDQETNALDVNLRAADEIARQLRLRDMGGIIVIDFIDMAKNEHRQQLFDHMREIMSKDRARHNILPLSKFGLMQITRQRVRPVMDIAVTETCPSCFGKGEVQPSILFTDTLKEKIEYLTETLGQKDFILYVHPYVDAFIKKGLFTSLYGKWRRKFGRRFKIIPDESLAYLHYRVIDKDGNELDLREEKDTDSATTSKVQSKLLARQLEEDSAEDNTTSKPHNQTAKSKNKESKESVKESKQPKGSKTKDANEPKEVSGEKPKAPEKNTSKKKKPTLLLPPVSDNSSDTTLESSPIPKNISPEKDSDEHSLSVHKPSRKNITKEVGKVEDSVIQEKSKPSDEPEIFEISDSEVPKSVAPAAPKSVIKPKTRQRKKTVPKVTIDLRPDSAQDQQETANQVSNN